MLILTRRLGESVKIGDDVTVTVLGVNGSHVRLGFAAPRDVPVHREEIYARMRTAPIDSRSEDVGETPRRPVSRIGTGIADHRRARIHDLAPTRVSEV